MLQVKKWSLVLVIIIAITSVALLAGTCGDPSSGDSPNNDPSGHAKSGSEKLIIGKWVVSQYQGIDGKVQSMDTIDPTKRITYTFDEKNIVVKWGNQGDQNGTYEWYINNANVTGITSIVVHFDAVTSGSVKSDANDVHFDIKFTDNGDYSDLILKVEETGEVSTLKREK